jgi:hypothetical protein
MRLRKHRLLLCLAAFLPMDSARFATKAREILSRAQGVSPARPGPRLGQETVR